MNSGYDHGLTLDVETYILSGAKILLVEDNDLDAETVIRGFAAQKIVNDVTRVNDGVEALEHLKAIGNSEHLPIVLLDLKMPRMDGLELLEHIRSSDDLRRALVFVLTASDDEKDKQRSFDLNVAGYIVKEKAGADFIRVFEMFERYWEVVELPSGLALKFAP